MFGKLNGYLIILITKLLITKTTQHIDMPNFANDPSRKSWLDS